MCNMKVSDHIFRPRVTDFCRWDCSGNQAKNIPADPMDKFGDCPLLMAAKKGSHDIATVLLKVYYHIAFHHTLPCPVLMVCAVLGQSRSQFARTKR